MEALFSSGRALDLIIGLCVLEALAFGLYRRFSGRGLALADMLPNLAAGVCLMLALRGALAGSHWAWTAAWLALAGVAHAMDLLRRLARA